MEYLRTAMHRLQRQISKYFIKSGALVACAQGVRPVCHILSTQVFNILKGFG